MGNASGDNRTVTVGCCSLSSNAGERCTAMCRSLVRSVTEHFGPETGTNRGGTGPISVAPRSDQPCGAGSPKCCGLEGRSLSRNREPKVEQSGRQTRKLVSALQLNRGLQRGKPTSLEVLKPEEVARISWGEVLVPVRLCCREAGELSRKTGANRVLPELPAVSFVCDHSGRDKSPKEQRLKGARSTEMVKLKGVPEDSVVCSVSKEADWVGFVFNGNQIHIFVKVAETL